MAVGDWHALVALGTEGGEPCADGDTVAPGAHLLWTFHPDLGFPAEGYRVWRRQHRPPEWACFNFEDALDPAPLEPTWTWLGNRFEASAGPIRLLEFACGKLPGLHLPGERTLEIQFFAPAIAVRASGSGEPPLVEVLGRGGDGLEVVGRVRPPASDTRSWSVQLWRDGIVGIRFTATDLRLCELCPGLFVDSEWDLLTREAILLPVVPRGTRNAASHIQAPVKTRAEAEARLSRTLSLPVRRALADGFAGDLRELTEAYLRHGGEASLPDVPTASASARTPPRLSLQAGGLLALTALDPDISRMLGLYWHDPVSEGRYDYRVVASHGKVRPPGRIIEFADVPLGPVSPAALVIEGVTIAGSGGLSGVDVAASDGTRRAIRIAEPHAGTVVGIHFSWAARSLTLRFATVGGVTFTGWRGGLPVTDGPATGGAVTLEHAGGIDAVTWEGGPYDLLAVELRRETGFVGELIAYAWNVAPHRAPRVGALTLTDAAAASEGTQLREDGTVSRDTGVVGLDWDGNETLNAGRPVRAQVARSDRGPGPRPEPDGDFEVVAKDRPSLAFARAGGRTGDWPGPDVPRRFTARGQAPGWSAWRVRGIDAFGRLGEWSRPRMVEVRPEPLPPAPDAVRARYLDPADPHLSASDRALTTADGAGLFVEWTWPASWRVRAPQVEPAGEFRIYLARGTTSPRERVPVPPIERPGGPIAEPLVFDLRAHAAPVGALAVVTTRILAVGTDGSEARVTLADPLPQVPSLPGLLASRGLVFPVVSQSGTQVVVRAVPSPDGSLEVPRATDPCTLWAGRAYEVWLPGLVLTPEEREAVATGMIAVTTSDGDPGVPDDPAWSAPGRGGLGDRPGREGPLSRVARIRVPHRVPPAAVAVVRPPQGDIPADQAQPADWYGRARYTLAFDTVPGATQYRVLRASTAALFEQDRILRRTASAPYGDGPFDDGGASAAWLAENHPGVSVANLTAHPDDAAVRSAWRGWAAWYYAARSNRQVMELADLPGNQEAFRPAHEGTIAGPPFRDSLDGRGLGRFVYRVRSVDASGNAGEWSLTFPVVEVRDVTPPKTPAIVSVLGGESAIAITWKANREPDLAGYRVWRARVATNLEDVRRRPVHAELTAEAGAIDVTWIDEGLVGGAEWHYRVEAFDASGNVSAPTPIVRGRAIDTVPPEPATWTDAAWVRLDAGGEVRPWSEVPPEGETWSAGVALSWEMRENGTTCLVERRVETDRSWTVVTGWLAPLRPHVSGANAMRFRWVDERSADEASTTFYRVCARDVAGNVTRIKTERLVTPPETA